MNPYRTSILLTIPLSMILMMGASCRPREVSFNVTNRLIKVGIYTPSGGDCDLDSPVVTLKMGLNHHVAWYSIDQRAYTVDFNTPKGSPFPTKSFLVKSDGSLEDPGKPTTDGYFQYRITYTGGPECKPATGTANDPYDPGLHIIK